MNLLLSFARFLKPIFGETAPGSGHAISSESLQFPGSQDITEQEEGLSYYTEMAHDPAIAAGLQYRRIARLWISAKGIREPGDPDGYAPPQILPFSDDSPDQQLWQFVCYLLDERLKRSMGQVLTQVQMSAMQYGRAVQELDWQIEDSGPYAGKVILNDIWDRDPDRFVLNPLDLPKGIYLKRSIYNATVSLADKLPDRKFWVIPYEFRFENRYGESACTPLINPEYGKRNMWTFWNRHLEKHGSPQMDATYPDRFGGEAHTTWRDNQFAALKKASHQAVIWHHEDVHVTPLIGSGENEGFASNIEGREREISLVLCGSATALQEGKYGSYSREESTTIRQKSALEQYDCQWIADAFNYDLIPWMIDWNFVNVRNYPYMQIIAPELIQPTTPEGQQDQQQADQQQQSAFGIKTFAGGHSGGGGASGTWEPAPESEPISPQEPTPEPEIEGFPNDPPVIPYLYSDPDVLRYAHEALSRQTVMLRADFDELEPEQKKHGFTISAIDNLDIMRTLHRAIGDSLDDPSEKTSWQAFEAMALQLFEQEDYRGIDTRSLWVSFRMARQRAYVLGIWAHAQDLDDRGLLYALQYQTMDDSDVRWNHHAMDGVIQPIESEFWQTWLPLNGFGCRCWPDIITQAQYAAEPEKYAMTDWNHTIHPDKGFDL